MKSRRPPPAFRSLTRTIMLTCLAILALVLATGEARAGQCEVGTVTNYFVGPTAYTLMVTGCRPEVVLMQASPASPQLLQVELVRPIYWYALDGYRPVLELRYRSSLLTRFRPRRPPEDYFLRHLRPVPLLL